MYLGLDLGTSSVKALLLAEYGTIIGSRSCPLQVTRPHAGWSEQAPEAWWDATDAAVQDLKAAFPKELASVRGIGLSGQMHGLTALDCEDRVLRPAILWNDTRSSPQADRLDTDHPDFRKIGGNAVMPGFTAPKAVWMRDLEPALFEKTKTILLPKDYLRLRLSGEKISDMSDAAGTLWMDVAARDWSDTLLGLCSLHRDQMPMLVEGLAPAGRLRPSIAMEWGISGQPVIAGGAGDNAAAAIGLGVVRDGDSFLSLGTSGVVFTVTDDVKSAPETGVHAFCHALPDRWHQMGVILAASDCVSWLCEITGTDIDTLMSELEATESTNASTGSDLLFHPYLSGERTPHNSADARAGFFGLARHHDRIDMTRAVLQGVAFAITDAITALRDAGANPDNLLATGGGAKNHRWLSYIATASNTNIIVPANGDFGAALGATRLAMMADGQTMEDVCQKPASQTMISPDNSLGASFQDSYGRWQDLYRRITA